MRISICIPVVGRTRLFAMALHSLLAQEHEDWQLCVRDGSPEPLSQHCDITPLFGVIGSRLRYEHGPNLGAVKMSNAALALSDAPIVNVMGSDDLLGSGALAMVSKEFERDKYPSTLWLYGKTVSITHDGRRTGIDGAPTTYADLLIHNRMGQPSVFVGRGALNLEVGFDPRFRYTYDYDLWLRLWRRREPLFLDQELGVYRHHEGQIVKAHAVELELEAEHVRLRHLTFGETITSARNVLAARRAFGGPIPKTVN